MNMKTDFQALATKLITSVFGDIAQQVIIRRPVYVNYDEETGAQLSSFDDYTITGVLGPWIDDNQAAANSSSIRTDDLSLIISKVQLEIDPEVNFDTAVLKDKSEWDIVYTEKDEAEATLTLRLSKGLEE